MNVSGADIKTVTNSYLTFTLGEDIFAFNVSSVLNILEPTKVTGIPHAPAYIKGVIRLRGNVLPLIDMRIRLGMEEVPNTANTSILVLEIHTDRGNIKIGALVDSVLEVMEFSRDRIVPPPELENRFLSAFLEGMARVMEEHVKILRVESILSDKDITDIRELADRIRQITQ